ncbi:unnamed protein product, partial [Candidula unifasciata]
MNSSLRRQNSKVSYPKFDGSLCSVNYNSCKDRCSSATSGSCSCHQTCTIYGTCCEDIDDHCPLDAGQDSQMLGQLKSSETQCRDGHFFVSSCPAEFSSSQWEGMKAWPDRSVTDRNQTGHNRWWFQYVDRDLEESQLSKRCETTDSTLDLIDKVPVTDIATQVHFKNIFCAICHNISQVEFWVTLANCQTQSNVSRTNGVTRPNSSLPDPETSSAFKTSSSLTRITQECQLAWIRPEAEHACASNPLENFGSTFAPLDASKVDSIVTQGA